MSTPVSWRRRPVVVVVAAGLIVLISMGLRQSFGIFMQPLGCVLGIDRESFGLAIALQNLLLGLPLAGYLADRYSARRVAMTGALVYAFAMFLMTEVGEPLLRRHDVDKLAKFAAKIATPGDVDVAVQ